jgi:hypothetical protein
MRPVLPPEHIEEVHGFVDLLEVPFIDDRVLFATAPWAS